MCLSDVGAMLLYVCVGMVLGEVEPNETRGEKLASFPLPRTHTRGRLSQVAEWPFSAGRKMTTIIFPAIQLPSYLQN